MRPVGILLAGGEARRMGGGDKPLRMLAGRPMLAHVIERLAPQVESLVISANGDPGRFAPFGLQVIADTVPGAPGPLAGILAGMEWAAAHHPQATHIVSAPADTPFLPPDLIFRLTNALTAGKADIAIAASGSHTHFATALWSIKLADDLRKVLRAGTVRVSAFAQDYSVTIVAFTSDTIDPFFNINTPEELAEAEHLLR
jgi:molybdopterin-guanine dinucleotide biosynthesis protein A